MVRIVKLARILKLDKLEGTGSIPFRPSGEGAAKTGGTIDFPTRPCKKEGY